MMAAAAALLHTAVTAQTAVDTARNAAIQFFKTYDSIPYITFDVKYTYFTDTAYSDFTHETMKGSYTMSGAKAKYSLGDVDYLQNDSFLVAVYHKDQMMVVSNPAPNAGGSLPMRGVLDSLLNASATDYDFSVDVTIDTIPSSVEDIINTTGYIRLTRKAGNTTAQFDKYELQFDIEKNTILKVEYVFTEPGQNLTSVDEPDPGLLLLKNTARKKTLRIDFANYRFDNFSDNVYSENNLIWEEDGEYKPVEQYKYYKVYNARN